VLLQWAERKGVGVIVTRVQCEVKVRTERSHSDTERADICFQWGRSVGSKKALALRGAQIHPIVLVQQSGTAVVVVFFNYATCTSSRSSAAQRIWSSANNDIAPRRGIARHGNTGCR
jgi:hypothetical protein